MKKITSFIFLFVLLTVWFLSLVNGAYKYQTSLEFNKENNIITLDEAFGMGVKKDIFKPGALDRLRQMRDESLAETFASFKEFDGIKIYRPFAPHPLLFIFLSFAVGIGIAVGSFVARPNMSNKVPLIALGLAFCTTVSYSKTYIEILPKNSSSFRGEYKIHPYPPTESIFKNFVAKVKKVDKDFKMFPEE